MKYIFIVLATCYFTAGWTQSNFCGTSVEDQRIALQQLESHSKTPIIKDGGFLYIPMVVHNVGNDNSLGYYGAWNLFESLCTLNEDFEPSGIQFYLEKDFHYINKSSWNDHPEFNDGEQMMRQNNFKNVANCYLVSNPAGNCGYYTYSGDAVALGKSCLGKRSHTWAHEMGHYFSLPHTFYGWEGIQYSNSKETVEYQSKVFTAIENVNRDNCENQADRFCDTEPDYISNRWTCVNDGFSGAILRDTKDSTFRVDGTLFMSYSNDDCMRRFSAEQMNAMYRNIDGPRSYLKRNNVIPKYLDDKNFALHYPVDSTTVPTKKIHLAWEQVENAKYYVLQISRTENFTIIMKNLLLTEPQVEIDTLIQGKNYWWRVRAYSEFDFCGTESTVGIFKTEPIITSVEDEHAENLTISPNPVSSYSFVRIPTSSELHVNPEIRIYSLNGKSITPKSISSNQNSTMIELDYLPDGFYYVNTRYSQTSKTYKLVVKNR